MDWTHGSRAVALAVTVALVTAAGVLLLGRAEGQAPAPPTVALDGEPLAAKGRGSGPPVAPGARPGSGPVAHVHVAGAVRRPGLYRIPTPARVAAAVARAGGPARAGDLDAVNLAAPLQDGQQVVVPRRTAVPRAGAGAVAGGAGTGGAGPTAAAGGASSGAGDAGGTGGAGAISLTTATLEQLETLDGIGPALAQRIISYRETHGGFRSVEELREVEGIGDKRFEALRGAVRL